jgi:tetratricopeptide (TPR) repeat protein
MNKIKKAALILIGIVTGLAIVELSCCLILGFPYKHILDGSSRAYYGYECYKNFIMKEYSKDGRYKYCANVVWVQGKKDKFYREKDKSTKRIFIAGESTAGIFARGKAALKRKLEKQIKGYNFEIIDCSAFAYNSTRLVPVIKEITGYNPDLIILFMGNNSEWIKFYKKSLLRNAFFRFIYERSWVVYAFYKPYLTRIENKYDFLARPGQDKIFLKDYKDIINICKKNNIPLVIFALPISIKNSMPTCIKNRELYRKKEYFYVRHYLEAKNYASAIKVLKNILSEQGYKNDVYVYYYLGYAYEKLGKFSMAKDCYIKSIEYEQYPYYYRCSLTRNKDIIKMAERNNIPVVDAHGLFCSLSENGMPGWDMFFDWCHWYTDLNGVMSDELIKSIYKYNEKEGASILANNNEWDFQQDNSEYLRVKNNIKRGKYINKYVKLGGLTFLSTTMCLWNLEDYVPEYFIEDYLTRLYLYNKQLLLDIILMKRKILINMGIRLWHDTAKAKKNWYKILWAVGETLRRQGDNENAIRYFDESIKIKPKQLYPYLFRGWAYYNLGEKEKALQDWKKVIKKDPAYIWLEDIIENGIPDTALP